MEKQQCGECHIEINDLEPVRCGFCETSFHISQNCCGINMRSCKEGFAQGKFLFVCTKCRNELNGRSIRAYISDEVNRNATPTATDNINTQLQQLSGVVAELSRKVDNIANISTPKAPVFREMKTPVWPAVGTKRRRGENGLSLAPVADRGTGEVDLSDLSVPFITPAVSPPKFWLYLSGFQPLITNDDVQKIVARCLNLTNSFDVIRLVPKGADTTNMSYISFKIGLDLSLKQQALDATRWPTGLMFREFVDFSKNRRPFSLAREQAAVTPTQQQPLGNPVPVA